MFTYALQLALAAVNFAAFLTVNQQGFFAESEWWFSSESGETIQLISFVLQVIALHEPINSFKRISFKGVVQFLLLRGHLAKVSLHSGCAKANETAAPATTATKK